MASMLVLVSSHSHRHQSNAASGTGAAPSLWLTRTRPRPPWAPSWLTTAVIAVVIVQFGAARLHDGRFGGR